jgi:hypothetical protein
VLLAGPLFSSVVGIAARPAASAVPSGTDAFHLYVSTSPERPDAQALTPLDPLTLGDDLVAPVIELGDQLSATWVSSDDGLALIGIEGPPGMSEPTESTLLVRDGRSDDERLRFRTRPAPGDWFNPPP